MQDEVPRSFAARMFAYAAPLLWAVNVLLIVSLASWLFLDGSSRDALLRQLGALAWPMEQSVTRQIRSAPLAIGAVGAVVTSAGVLLSLVMGPRKSRSTRRWLLATALACLWLALATNWETLHWRGQQTRMALQLATFKQLAAELDDAWPSEDGDRPSLGPFLAYPHGSPRTLLLLGEAPAAPVAAVERSLDGALRFQLTGESGGVWVERSPSSARPAPFVGGLRTLYTPTRVAPLGDGWRLVRYAESAQSPIQHEFSDVH